MTTETSTRWARWVAGVGVVQFVLVLGCLTVARAQVPTAQETINNVALYRIDNLTERVLALEALKFDTRVTLLESDMTEVKWLGRTVAGLLLAQLIAAALEKRKRGVLE